jgi:hypothetical protein
MHYRASRLHLLRPSGYAPRRWTPSGFLLLFLGCSTGTVDGETGLFSASLGEGNVDNDELDTDEGDSTTESGESESGESDSTSEEEEESESTTTEDEESTTESDTTETGDPDPCPLICDGSPDGTPTSCDAPYVIGRSSAKDGFFFGGNTTSAMDNDHDVCGPMDNPDNWDSGHDHFFRIWLQTGDQIDVTMTGQFDKRVKVHDEADCVGNAKDCSDGVLSYTALEDDWVTIVADGQSVAFMDWGDYTLTVQLTLAGPDACNCL